MVVPTNPFEVNYQTVRAGERQLPPRWSVPYDTSFREVEEPNAPVASLPAYTSVGWHVVKNGLRYLPAYKVVGTLNMKLVANPATIKSWEETVGDGLTITDRRSGNITHILAATSIFEAVTSWFVREQGHEDSVLCCDRKEVAPHGGGVWYIESKREELRVTLDAEGREVSTDEEHVAEHYLLLQHPDAVMLYGE